MSQDTSLPSLTLLVCGKTGVGKSYLTNVIFGAKVTTSGGPGSSVHGSNAMDRVTSCVEKHTKVVRNVNVTVYDTPGFQDKLGKDEEYLNEIEKVIEEAHVILYCFEMTTARMLEPDEAAIKLVTGRFGLKFWTKAILVLTKANMYQNGKSPKAQKAIEQWEKTCEDAFNDISNSFKKILHDLLPPEHSSAVNQIRVIAAGNDNIEPEDRELIFVAPGVKHTDYLNELITMCTECIPEDSSAFVLAVGFDEMKMSEGNQTLREYFKNSLTAPAIQEGNIPATGTSCEEKAAVTNTLSPDAPPTSDKLSQNKPCPESSNSSAASNNSTSSAVITEISLADASSTNSTPSGQTPHDQSAGNRTQIGNADPKPSGTTNFQMAEPTQRKIDLNPNQAKRILWKIFGAFLHVGGATAGRMLLSKGAAMLAAKVAAGGVTFASAKLGAAAGILGGPVGVGVGLAIGTAAGLAAEAGIQWAIGKL